MHLLVRLIFVFILFTSGSSLACAYWPASSDKNRPSDYYFKGQPDNALKDYLKLAQTGDTDSALNAAIVLQELGRSREALDILEKAASAKPGNRDLRSALAWTYLCAGKYAKAGVLFEKNIDKTAHTEWDTLGLAVAETEQKKYAKAAFHLQVLAQTERLSALTQYYTGRIYKEQGKPSQAAAAYEKVIKKDSHFVEARPMLARIYESLRRIDDAWRQYFKITLMDPFDKLASEKKRELLTSLTKKPEEIVVPTKIKGFTMVKPAPERSKSPKIRIGLGTSPSGLPVYRQKITFRSAGLFSITDAKTGKVLASGRPNEAWSVTVKSATGPVTAEIIGPDGKLISAFSGSAMLRQKEPGKATVILDEIPYAPGMSWSGVADKELRGDIEIRFSREQKGLFAINELPLEEYLYGVIAAEMPVHWPTEALKAQAVIARTFAVYLTRTLKPHAQHSYDLCDDQHCQVYTGVSAESPKARSAVDLTRGRILLHNGKPIHAVFSSNCGGITQDGGEIKWAKLPYWQSVFDGADGCAPQNPSEFHAFLWTSPDIYCKASKYTWTPESRWTRIIPADALELRLNREKTVGKLKHIAITRGPSGRVASITFTGAKGNAVFTKEHKIRRILGIGPLRSTMFGLHVFYKSGAVKMLLIYGAGWGHGVGLCQSGAAGRAESGMGYDKILRDYYQGAILGELTTPKTPTRQQRQ